MWCTAREWRNQREAENILRFLLVRGSAQENGPGMMHFVRQLSSCFFCRYRPLFSATTTRKKPVVNDQISAIEHTPVNTLKACDGTKCFIISTTQFFFLSFRSAFCLVTDHTDTYRFFSPQSSALETFLGLEFHQLPGHFPQQQSTLLTWIWTQLLIFVCIGCLSAACVLKMSTHSFSGARHRRQQALPRFCVIVDVADPFNDFFFLFTVFSCRRWEKLLVISLESHTVFSGNAADSELACILSVSVHFFSSSERWLCERQIERAGKIERVGKVRGWRWELRSVSYVGNSILMLN